MSAPTYIDASTFQRPLAELASTMALKVEREGHAHLGSPAYVAIDLGVLLRMTTEALNLIWYINSDEKFEGDPSHKSIYSVVTAPLVRNFIDNLYNATYILLDPARHGRTFRLNGIRKEQRDLNEDELRYGGKSEWDAWLKDSRDKLSDNMRALEVSQAEVEAEPDWMTLGRYLSQKGPGGSLTPHQQFLSTFMYGPWREYSAMAHGAPEALRDIGMFYTYKEQPFEDRPKIDDALERVRSLHIMRGCVVLIALITELQAVFHFRDANIDSRLHSVWNAVLMHPEAKELYDARYSQLMADKGILP